jgi:hypothetical protein
MTIPNQNMSAHDHAVLRSPVDTTTAIAPTDRSDSQEMTTIAATERTDGIRVETEIIVTTDENNKTLETLQDGTIGTVTMTITMTTTGGTTRRKRALTLTITVECLRKARKTGRLWSLLPSH